MYKTMLLLYYDTIEAEATGWGSVHASVGIKPV